MFFELHTYQKFQKPPTKIFMLVTRLVVPTGVLVVCLGTVLKKIFFFFFLFFLHNQMVFDKLMFTRLLLPPQNYLESAPCILTFSNRSCYHMELEVVHMEGFNANQTLTICPNRVKRIKLIIKPMKRSLELCYGG